ncbi:unknown protein [Microcystis aeruginosa NIES-843]|uniref:Uncharacterized protein n=1 Tax=Microcystis aeruginosa (strain NIES-843 / IAM M-2473) TaxID=449447 RepID=B0JJZ2_MICAN|nr:unknown protein [Microcystis aeruginosa NIES-843]
MAVKSHLHALTYWLTHHIRCAYIHFLLSLSEWLPIPVWQIQIANSCCLLVCALVFVATLLPVSSRREFHLY